MFRFRQACHDNGTFARQLGGACERLCASLCKLFARAFAQIKDAYDLLLEQPPHDCLPYISQSHKANRHFQISF
jgi:hypothetical protein